MTISGTARPAAFSAAINSSKSSSSITAPGHRTVEFRQENIIAIYCINVQYLGGSMSKAIVPAELEALHPSLWRASQLGHSRTRCIDTGYPTLSNLLPGGGWPTGALVDLLVQQPGIGEMRLLAPALAKISSRKVALLQPPHTPQVIALAAMGVPPASAYWLRANRTADALWAAEQVLRSGSCGALLFWQNQIRSESLRRLHLAAQAGETLFVLMRPIAAAQDPAPAPLRLGLRPKAGGLEIEFVKRQGPRHDEPLFLPMHVGAAHVFKPRRQTTLERVATEREVVASQFSREVVTSADSL
jgi:protein ImuA